MSSGLSTSQFERLAFATRVACLLAPVVAQGLWCPLVHLVGSGGSAPLVTGSALTVFGLTALARWMFPEAKLGMQMLLGALLAAGFSAGLSLGSAGLGALLPVALTSGWLLHALPAHLPASFDGLASRHRHLFVLYLLVASVSAVWTARLSIFVGDPAAADHHRLPPERRSRRGTVASPHTFGRPSERARAWKAFTPTPGGTGRWGCRSSHLDNFNYPPTFLVMVSPPAPLDGDFAAQRALWFGLNGLLTAFGLAAVARWVGGPAAHRVVLLAPLFFGSIPFLLALQIGNFHLAATILAVLAMVAFERGRLAIGGGLLAVAILSKVSPGILGVVLLRQRRALEAALAAGFGALLSALALAVYGTSPFVSFLTVSLPNPRSGAAFPPMATEAGSSPTCRSSASMWVTPGVWGR